MIRNVQLKHSGKYVCMVHTAVDSVSAAADLIVRGMCISEEAVQYSTLFLSIYQI